jgi:hypothetical protein
MPPGGAMFTSEIVTVGKKVGVSGIHNASGQFGLAANWRKTLKICPFPETKPWACVMRRTLLIALCLAICVWSLSGCCILSFWSSASNAALNLDLGKIGTGEQAVSSPNAGQPWQGDKVEKATGF